MKSTERNTCVDPDEELPQSKHLNPFAVNTLTVQECRGADERVHRCSGLLCMMTQSNQSNENNH